MKRIGSTRRLPIAISAGALALAFVAATDANAQPYVPPTGAEEDQFDDNLDVYVGFGAMNLPYSGSRDIDYSDSFDPGYQWGLGVGWFERPNDSRFGIGIGGFFDHAIVNAERQLDLDGSEHLFRFGLELRPGFVLADRVFFNLALRGGYAADIAEVNDEIELGHGPLFGVAGGLDVAIFNRAYIGTAVGTDLHFFRGGEDVNAYFFSWRTHLGFRF